MKWMIVVGLALAAMVAIVVATGALLPERHTSSRTAKFAVAPELVWNAITDVESFPSWRADVTRVERVQHASGRTAWVEEGRNGRMTLAVERSEPPRLLVLRIADKDLPFGGTWTYAVEAVDGGSRLTITENGEIYNPVFRFMARFVFGYEATMQGYLLALGKRLEAGS